MVETTSHLPLYINWHDMVSYLYRILAIHNEYVRLGFTILMLTDIVYLYFKTK